MADAAPLLTKVENNIGILTLNRPEKRNALNGELVQALTHAIMRFTHDDAIHVLLIKGNGENFCAGADLNWMVEVSRGSYMDNCNDAEHLADMLYALHAFPKPTVVMAHGMTFGGGLGLMCAADISVTSSDATFGFSEVTLGLSPSTISPYVVAAIGERYARYYFLTGKRFNSEEAYRIGLVHDIFAQDALEQNVMALLDSLKNYDPAATHAIKQLLQLVNQEKISEALAQKTAEHLAEVRSSKTGMQGVIAFLQRKGQL